MRRPLRLLAAAAVAALAVLAVLAVPTSAAPATAAPATAAPATARAAALPLTHAVLVRTEPAATAELDRPPTRVAVEFAAPLLQVGAELAVSADGRPVARGAAAVSGGTLSLPLTGKLPAGHYQVIWRATSADGHVVSGSFDFTAAGPGQGAPGTAAGLPGAAGSPSGNAGTGRSKAAWMLTAMALAGTALAVMGSRRRAARQAAER